MKCRFILLIVIIIYLIIEIQRMWNMKAKVISVKTGTTGTISKSLRQYLSNILGKSEIKELQKTVILCHCTHTVESANVKYTTYFTEEITLHRAQTVSTEEQRHWFRYIIINTVHKGDNNDVDDDDHDNNNNCWTPLDPMSAKIFYFILETQIHLFQSIIYAWYNHSTAYKTGCHLPWLMQRSIAKFNCL